MKQPEPGVATEAELDAVRAKAEAIHAQHRDALPMWAVFDPFTSDQPGLFVARLTTSLPAPVVHDVLLGAGTLEEIRRVLPRGLARLSPSAGDSPNILEIWL